MISDIEQLKQVFACIDHTTLNGSDTRQHVQHFCYHTLQLCDKQFGIDAVATVCVYPVFVRLAQQCLQGSSIAVASVAGAFPSGQASLELKRQEVQYALDEGADEIDLVISYGRLLEGDIAYVYDEVATIREITQGRLLKVILETGELKTPALIAQAAETVIAAGADFIKTSTGKTPIGATLQAAEVMLEAIKKHRQDTGRIVGFKVAGGISTPGEVLKYSRLATSLMGEEYINKQTFRVGASRLTENLFSFLT